MRTNIFKTSVILFSLFSLTACSKPSNQSSNQVEASSATVVEESAASETIHPVSEPMENQKVKSEDATKQALASYKKEKEDSKCKDYAAAVIYSIDELKSLDYEINSAAETDGLFQVTEIEDLKFLNSKDKSATYNVKVGVIRGGHVTSSCNVEAIYDDSIGQIEWTIPTACYDF